jgi:hypothetical protein
MDSSNYTEIKNIRINFESLKKRSLFNFFDFLATNEKINFIYLNKKNIKLFFCGDSNYFKNIREEIKYFICLKNLSMPKILYLLSINLLNLDSIICKKVLFSYMMYKDFSFTITEARYIQYIKKILNHFPIKLGTSGYKNCEVKRYSSQHFFRPKNKINFRISPGIGHMGLFYVKLNKLFSDVDALDIKVIHKLTLEIFGWSDKSLEYLKNFIKDIIVNHSLTVKFIKLIFDESVDEQKLKIIFEEFSPYIKLFDLERHNLKGNPDTIIKFLNLDSIKNYPHLNKIILSLLLNICPIKEQEINMLNILGQSLKSNIIARKDDNDFKKIKDTFTNLHQDKKIYCNLYMNNNNEENTFLIQNYKSLNLKKLFINISQNTINTESYPESYLLDLFKIVKNISFYLNLDGGIVNLKYKYQYIYVTIKDKFNFNLIRKLASILNLAIDQAKFIDIKCLINEIDLTKEFFEDANNEVMFSNIKNLKFENLNLKSIKGRTQNFPNLIKLLEKTKNIQKISINIDLENQKLINYDMQFLILYDSLSTLKDLNTLKIKIPSQTYHKSDICIDHYLSNLPTKNNITDLTLSSFNKIICNLINKNFHKLRVIRFHIKGDLEFIEDEIKNLNKKINIVISTKPIEFKNINKNFKFVGTYNQIFYYCKM